MFGMSVEVSGGCRHAAKIKTQGTISLGTCAYSCNGTLVGHTQLEAQSKDTCLNEGMFTLPTVRAA